MLFIWVAIFAYFLFAINAVIDKYLLHQSRIGHPATYAFAIGTLSLVVIVLVPFGFEILPAEVIYKHRNRSYFGNWQGEIF